MTNNQLNSLCVYCGSGHGENSAYGAAARALGREMGERNLRLIYGGGSIGLMGVLAEAAIESGAAVTGIIPEFLVRKERMLEAVKDLRITRDMHERKRLMFEESDAFVALPGGIGTLEEVIEMMTWSQLGQHNKPVLLANIAGFWDPLLV
ncbi:MAG: TIGR00730 family Rossman fold protein, partial [Pseudomonadota bacterium]